MAVLADMTKLSGNPLLQGSTDHMSRLTKYRPGAKALFVAVAVLVTLVLITALGLLRETQYQLRLEISCSVPSDAQVFYDIGRGYNQADSRTLALPPGAPGYFQTLSFPIPSGVVSHIRFDPIATAGSFSLRRVVMRSPWGETRIAPSEIKPLNQIEHQSRHEDTVTFVTSPNANDPGLIFNLHHSIDCTQHKVLYAITFILSLTLLCLLVGPRVKRFFARAATGLAERLPRSHVERIHARVSQWADALSDPDFIRFDAGAIYFIVLCFICFVVAVAADLNGSSIGIYNSGYHIGAPAHVLAGQPRAIRADEWAYETPLILNQVQKVDRFSAGDSFVGGHRVSLIADAPVYHFSTWFRPQFWGFFVLPMDYAFAAFWQFKALLLVTGVFAFLLLLTQSSFWAATGSLWYFFSPLTQWTYSWPSGLPEMVGLMLLTVVFSCYLTIGKNSLALLLASIAAASCMVNFVLCGYVLHLLPLAWFGIVMFLSWCIGKRRLIFSREAATLRIIAILSVLALAGFTGNTLRSQLHVAIEVISHTVYPGQRRLAGGTYPMQGFISHFFEWTETETHFLPALSNICEASGFLWLAPFTLFLTGGLSLAKFQKYVLAGLWLFSSVLLIWLIFPVPERYGKWMLLNMTGGTRCLPPLGLANIVIVSLCMSSLRRCSVSQRPRDVVFRVTGIFLIVLCVLDLADKVFAGYFAPLEMYIAACATTVLIELLISGRKRWLALALVFPQAVLFATVNPTERGIDVVTSSELFKFVHTHKELKEGKWFAFSMSEVESGYLASLGLNVYTGVKYLPDIDHYHLFQLSGLPLDNFNRDGLLLAQPLQAGARAVVQAPAPYLALWNISPSDPILKAMGVRYFAFSQKPAAQIEAQLVPLSSGAISGLWIYRSK